VAGVLGLLPAGAEQLVDDATGLRDLAVTEEAFLADLEATDLTCESRWARDDFLHARITSIRSGMCFVRSKRTVRRTGTSITTRGRRILEALAARSCALLLPMTPDINVSLGRHVFMLRVAAIVLRENRVLTCRFEDEAWCFLPGGRVGAGEPTARALRREIAEELDATCEVERPVFLLENFFTLDGKSFHELGVYYLARLPELLPASVVDGGRTLFFEWVQLCELTDRNLQPAVLRKLLAHPPAQLTHIVHTE